MLRTKQKTAQTLDMSCADYEKEATFLLYVTKSLYKKKSSRIKFIYSEKATEI